MNKAIHRSFKFLLGFIVSIATLNSIAQVSAQDFIAYQAAMEDAIYLKKSNVYDGLISITKANKDLIWKTVNGEDYVLMLSLKGSSVKYYEPYLNWGFFNTGDWPVWVTAAPQLLNFMKKENAKDVNMRLKQLLGLPPSSVYTHFVELWVKPSDLFRPCLDSEITDKTCELCFPSTADSTYKAWINNTRLSRYYPDPCGLMNEYPWTCLGYTYDWNMKNKTHVGMSEFVIPSYRNVVVNGIYTIEEYLKKK
ncbi:MAG: hypothetical protein JKY48_17625 [Flavobacteriales bacterium]|nr:hypothetical protein [Flavobacteriales bacterium]